MKEFEKKLRKDLKRMQAEDKVFEVCDKCKHPTECKSCSNLKRILTITK